MAKIYGHDNVEFLSNKYAAILDHSDAPCDYPIVQDLLGTGPLGYALTQPGKISASAAL